MGTPGKLTVLDTNVMLEYLPPQQIPWTQLLDADRVRLIIPLRVVEELDAKKYSGQRLAPRARALLPWLEEHLGPGGIPGPIGDGVTIEVPIEAEGRVRPADADAEILTVCQDTEQLSGRAAVLMTADTSMRIRAQAAGITVLRPPAKFRRHDAAVQVS